MRILLLSILVLLCHNSNASTYPAVPVQSDAINLASIIPQNTARWKIKVAQKLFQKKEKPKLTAITLAVLLGPFGVHRLYLGTSPHVPVVYTLTLGGGIGILPFTDIIAIIMTKNLDKFKDSDKVIMWTK